MKVRPQEFNNCQMAERISEEIERRTIRVIGTLRILREVGHQWDHDLGASNDLVVDELDYIRTLLIENECGKNPD